MKKVKVYNSENRTTTEIPESELAPGMVLTDMEGVGQVFMHHSEIKRDPSPKAPLPEGFADCAKAVYGLVPPLRHRIGTEEKWITGFAADQHPVRELMLWMWFAAVFHKMTHEGKDTLHLQLDVFDVISQAMNNGEQARQTMNPKRISRARALKVIDAFREGNNNPEPFFMFWNERVDIDRLVEMRNEEEARG